MAPPDAATEASPAAAPPPRPHWLSGVSRGWFGRLVGGLVLALAWPFTWLRYTAARYVYACWLTWRYVDDYTRFPAIRFDPYNRFTLHIFKEPGARLRINKVLSVKGFPGASTDSQIFLCAGSSLEIDRTFEIGDNVRINLGPGARLQIAGKHKTSYSGLPGSCIVYVKQSMRFEKDMGFSWKTLVMDSDWHMIGGKFPAEEVVIGEHVWVAPNAHVLKGARIGANSIVGTGAVVFKGDYPERSFLVGAPAKVLRSNIPDWKWEWPKEHAQPGSRPPESGAGPAGAPEGGGPGGPAP